jgi:hypothetical protein
MLSKRGDIHMYQMTKNIPNVHRIFSIPWPTKYSQIFWYVEYTIWQPWLAPVLAPTITQWCLCHVVWNQTSLWFTVAAAAKGSTIWSLYLHYNWLEICSITSRQFFFAAAGRQCCKIFPGPRSRKTDFASFNQINKNTFKHLGMHI